MLVRLGNGSQTEQNTGAEMTTMTAERSSWTPIDGDTYPVREELKAMGCWWDKAIKKWRCPPENLVRANAAVLAHGTGSGSESEAGLEWKICEVLENSFYTWTQTNEIWTQLNRDRSVVRPALYALEARGIVRRQGTKKYHWKLNTKEWRDAVDKDGHDPKTPMKPVKKPSRDNRVQFKEQPVDDGDGDDEIEDRLSVVEDKVRGVETYQVIEDSKIATLEDEIRKLKARPVGGGEITITVKKPTGKPKKIKAVLPAVFPHILELAQARRNILLVGPTGCGKSHVAKLVADTLGLPFGAINCTAGMSETHLNGRSIPNVSTGKGRFQTTDYLRMTEGGGVFCLDEIDAADANLLLVFNTATSNGYCNVPNRPEKPIATVHDDFILIATANTYGRGADRVYVGRNQLDEATLDRFRIGTVEMGFDLGVEASFKIDDEGNDFIPYDPPEDYVTRYSRLLAELGYNLRGTLQYIRHRIEQAKTLRRLMTTRFIRDAIIMRESAGWTTQKILEVYFQGWSEDELRRIS